VNPAAGRIPEERILPYAGFALVLSRQRAPSGRVSRATAMVYGSVVSPKTFEPVPGQELVGVHIQPELLRPLLGAGAGFLLNDGLPLARIAPNLARDLERMPIPDRPLSEALAVLVARSRDAVRDTGAQGRKIEISQLAAARIRELTGQQSMDELAQDLLISSRHLARVFQNDLGLSPKRVAQLVRFNHALERLDRDPTISGAELAAVAGYCDQSHLSAEFRRVAGMPPGALARSRHST
jgi:AraC-like DNA-binding protein